MIERYLCIFTWLILFLINFYVEGNPEPLFTGDESHTATEGEGGEDDDDDEDEDEAVRRARELRRMEVNIDVAAPPRKAETSDSGSDTEVILVHWYFKMKSWDIISCFWILSTMYISK